MAGTTSLRFLADIVDRISPGLDRMGDKVEALAAKMRALDSVRAKPKVEVAVSGQNQVATLERSLKALPNRVTARLDVTGAAGAAANLAGLATALRQLDGHTATINVAVRGDVGALAQLASLRALLAVIGTLGGGGGGPGGGLSGVLGGATGWAVKLGAALLKAALGATALAAAGFAIQAAFGAASTGILAAVGSVPLLAAGIAAVAVGLDGVKRAAASIKPETDALKASVSAAFERGLTPALREAVGTFPAIEKGLVGTADALSLVALRTAEWATSAVGLTLIRDNFVNINRALVDMQPGIENFLSGLLQIGASTNLFDVLSATVADFGADFKANVLDLVSDGTLDAAFSGLQRLLGSVSQGFNDLVNEGIRSFVAAQPGLTSAVDAVLGLFTRFNEVRIGTAAGDALQGIADAINSIPQSTIDDITLSIEGLGRAFGDPSFQQGVRDFAAALPTIVGWMGDLVNVAGGAATSLGGFVKVVEGLQQASTGDIAGGLAKINEGLNQIKVGTANAFPMEISLTGGIEASEQLARIASQIAILPEGAKSIVVEGPDPAVLETLEAIGAKVETLPDGRVRITLDGLDAAQSELSTFLTGKRPPIRVPIEPDDSALNQWVPPAVDPIPVPLQPQSPDPPLSSIIPGSFSVKVHPDLTQAIPVIAGFRALAEAPTASVHTITHNVPQVAAEINALNSADTTAPHVQTHNVPSVIAAINTLNGHNTSSAHVVSHNVPSVISALNSLNGHDTSSTHTVTTVRRTVLASGGALVGARAGTALGLAAGGILPGYAPGRDRIPAMLSPGESVLTPEATRALGARFITGLNRQSSGRRGVTVGHGSLSRGGGIPGPNVSRKLDETNTLLRGLMSVLINRDGVTVNVTGSPVGDPAETAQAIALKLHTL